LSAFLAANDAWAVLGVALTGSLLVVLNDRRLLPITLGLQYFLAGWLAVQSLGPDVAAAQVVGGLLATGIIWLTWRGPAPSIEEAARGHDLMSMRSFRWVSVLLVLFAAWGLGRRAWMGLPDLTPAGTLAATFLLLLGLLQASLYRHPMRVILGLLTLLSGFGIAYGAVESSLAVIALVILVHLGLALAGSYLTIVQGPGTDGRLET
jgi:hypothetical protein